jgi:hypothetical protein
LWKQIKFHIRCAYFTPNRTWSPNYSVLVFSLTWSDLLISQAHFANFFPNYSRTSSRTVLFRSVRKCISSSSVRLEDFQKCTPLLACYAGDLSHMTPGGRPREGGYNRLAWIDSSICIYSMVSTSHSVGKEGRRKEGSQTLGKRSRQTRPTEEEEKEKEEEEEEEAE